MFVQDNISLYDEYVTQFSKLYLLESIVPDMSGLAHKGVIKALLSSEARSFLPGKSHGRKNKVV